MAEGLSDQEPLRKDYSSRSALGEEIDGDSLSSGVRGQPFSPPPPVDCTSTQSGPYGAILPSNDELVSPTQESDEGRSGSTSQDLGHKSFIQGFQHRRLRKSIPRRVCLPCTLSILIAVIIIGLLPNYFTVQNAIIHRYRQQYSSQAIAGDVIDCGVASTTQKRFISEVEITQIATNENFDNKKGLPMNIVSIPITDLQFHNITYTGTSSIPLTKDIKTLIIPEGYVNRPVYLWTNSNITVQVNISNFISPPNKLVGYIFHGDDNFGSYYNNPSSSPNYEYSWNILDSNLMTYTQTIKRNGYYYIVVTVQTEHNFTLSTKVEFDILYLSSDDYDLTNGQYVDTVGTTIKENLGFYNNNITLCFVSETNSQKSSIHVLLSYNLRTWFVFIVSLIEYAGLLVILVILLLLIIFGLKKVCRVNICTSRDCFKFRRNNSLVNEDLQPLVK